MCLKKNINKKNHKIALKSKTYNLKQKLFSKKTKKNQNIIALPSSQILRIFNKIQNILYNIKKEKQTTK